MTEWFEEWFGEEYLQLYPHRDVAEAERAVALILERTGFAAGWRVLDVACGAGRHARAFQAAGARASGWICRPPCSGSRAEVTTPPSSGRTCGRCRCGRARWT